MHPMCISFCGEASLSRDGVARALVFLYLSSSSYSAHELSLVEHLLLLPVEIAEAEIDPRVKS